MHVAMYLRERIPAHKYGGTERVVWWLGKELVRRGHRLSLLAPAGSTCDFAQVIPVDERVPLSRQVPADCDLVHLHAPVAESFGVPAVLTNHWASGEHDRWPANTIFISADQAKRGGGSFYIHHGLDLDAYGPVDFDRPQQHLIFLAKASRKNKNLKGAMAIARRARRRLAVAGGTRLNFSSGFRLTLDWNVRFHGMVADQRKRQLLQQSQALLFPILWPEPFGLALIEALYYGNPVFGTPYGSLPELIVPDVGVLSLSQQELVERLHVLEDEFDRRRCHGVCVRPVQFRANGRGLSAGVRASVGWREFAPG